MLVGVLSLPLSELCLWRTVVRLSAFPRGLRSAQQQAKGKERDSDRLAACWVMFRKFWRLPEALNKTHSLYLSPVFGWFLTFRRLCGKTLKLEEKACQKFVPSEQFCQMSSSSSPPQVGSCKMELRVAAIVLLMVAMAAGHGSYVVKKMVKAPQYQPYSVKSQGKKTLLSTSCFLAS